LEEETVKELTSKIMEVVKDNFEGVSFDEIIMDSESYDEDAHNFEAFYGSIKYDIEKILRGK
jgi:hypothetical protein